MTESKSEKNIIQKNSSAENVCNLRYLNELMGGKKNLIKSIMDAFLKQIPDELDRINSAVSKTDFANIKSLAHTMRSFVSIMSISVLTPILQEMEDLGAMATDIEKIKELNLQLHVTCSQAIEEIEREKLNYV